MKESNLYWPIYKNIENDVIKLSSYLSFSDDQKNVYSIYIADLIVRISIEIESISKELYKNNGGKTTIVESDNNPNNLLFDIHCLNYLNKIWKLEKKQINIISNTFYFYEKSNLTLTPLKNANKNGEKGCQWKRAYQALKHDRYNSLKKATIWNLLNALGALYILNIYYKNTMFNLGNLDFNENNRFDNRLDSMVFSVNTFTAFPSFADCNFDDSFICNNTDDLESSIYIIKYADDSIKEVHKACSMDARITYNKAIKVESVREFLKNNPESRNKALSEICIELGGNELYGSVVSSQYMKKAFDRVKIEAILNINTNIYPYIEKISDEVLDLEISNQ